MGFRFTPLELPGAILVESDAHRDPRGFFAETYKRSEFVAAGIDVDFVQDNHSRSIKRVLRGLHYQREPAAQGKLVRAVVGEIFDVAVDIRHGSPTFGAWVGVSLSAENGRMVYVPPWCAHGFCVVSDVAEVVYKATAEYAPELEAGVIWNDRVRACSLRELKLLHLARRGIEPPRDARPHPRPPDRAVRRFRGVANSLAQSGGEPFRDLDLDFALLQDRAPVGFVREVRCQITGHLVGLRVR